MTIFTTTFIQQLFFNVINLSSEISTTEALKLELQLTKSPQLQQPKLFKEPTYMKITTTHFDYHCKQYNNFQLQIPDLCVDRYVGDHFVREGFQSSLDRQWKEGPRIWNFERCFPNGIKEQKVKIQTLLNDKYPNHKPDEKYLQDLQLLPLTHDIPFILIKNPLKFLRKNSLVLMWHGVGFVKQPSLGRVETIDYGRNFFTVKWTDHSTGNERRTAHMFQQGNRVAKHLWVCFSDFLYATQERQTPVAGSGALLYDISTPTSTRSEVSGQTDFNAAVQAHMNNGNENPFEGNELAAVSCISRLRRPVRDENGENENCVIL